VEEEYEEMYCPVCVLIHQADFAKCCMCLGKLIVKPDSSNGEDKTCPICVEQIQMA